MSKKTNTPQTTTRSKVSIFCSHAIEALWLFLLVGLPLFYFRSHQSFNMPKIQLLCITVSFMIVLLAIKSIEEGRFTMRKSPMVWLMTAYLAVMGLSTIFSYYPQVSWWGTYTRFEGMITYIFYFAAFYIIAWNMRSLTQVYRFIMVAAIGSLPVSIYGFLQYFGYDILKFNPDGRGFTTIISTLGNQLYLSDYLVLILPIVFCLGMMARRWQVRLAWFSLALADLYALILTGRRSGFVALVAIVVFGGFLMLWRWRRSAGIAFTLIFLIAAILIAFNFTAIAQSDFVQNTPYLKKATTIFNFEDTTVKERLIVWQLAAGYIIDRPIIGHGMETFGYVFDANYPPSFTKMPETIFDHAHNIVLDTAFNYGFIGLAVFLALFGLAVFINLRVFFREKEHWYSYIGLGLCLSLVGFLAHNQFMFENGATRYFIFSFLAVSSVLPQAIARHRKSAEQNSNDPGAKKEPVKFWASPEYKIFYYGLIIVAVAYSIKFHMFPIAGDYAYNKVYNYTKLEDRQERENELKRAMYYIPDMRSAVYYQKLASDFFIYGQNAAENIRDDYFQQSINWYKKGMEKDPRRYQIPQEAGQVYMIWSVFANDDAVAQERYEMANEMFAQTLAISPGRQSIYWDWGRSLIKIGKTEEGIAKYQHAVDMDPSVGRSYFELGKAYRDTDQPELARDAFDMARELGWTRGNEEEPL